MCVWQSPWQHGLWHTCMHLTHLKPWASALDLARVALGSGAAFGTFLAAPIFLSGAQAPMCESDAQMQSSHSRAWQGCSRGCSRLAQLSNGSQGAMVGTGHGGSPHNRTLETRGMLLSLKFGGRVVPLPCRHGETPLYPSCTHGHGNWLHQLVSA